MNNKLIQNYVIRHEQLLQNTINSLSFPCLRLKEGFHYALFSGGKRLRPLIVYLCGELVHVNPGCLDYIALAIELTHSYSLVHDDLPAMDNDDYRRGKLSCHRAFDEATAILIGDGMQALAIDFLLQYLPEFISPRQTIAVTRELINASGPYGMVSGQCLDLTELSQKAVDEDRLGEIHHLKPVNSFWPALTWSWHPPTPSRLKSRGFANLPSTLALLFRCRMITLINTLKETMAKKERLILKIKKLLLQAFMQNIN